MNILNCGEDELKLAGGYITAGEIRRQPDVWFDTAKKFFGEAGQIENFLIEALDKVDNIILTGAGTSAFIGHSLSGILSGHFKLITRVIPTTDIVSYPKSYFNLSHSTLVISFARSGNSPESVAALELADKYSKKCFHLVITCDGAGSLANYHSKNPMLVFVLPQEANDKGLAMTGSYTSMLLTGPLITMIGKKELANEQLEFCIRAAENLFNNDLDILENIAEKSFSRAVFLGSGPLFGTAIEAALKLEELTNGEVICKADTFLGFRHGPKVIVDKDTLVVYFFSNNKYALQYEIDLVHSMHKGNKALFQLGISEQLIDEIEIDKQLILSAEGGHILEDFQPLCFILPIQIISFFKSMSLGLKPDTPSSNGAISRVVEGVNIYPVEV